jgi:hypothetical protein
LHLGEEEVVVEITMITITLGSPIGMTLMVILMVVMEVIRAIRSLAVGESVGAI